MRYIVDDEAFTIEPLDASSKGAARSWFDDTAFEMLSRWWLQASWQRRYSYQFNWMGVPIIQLPTDVLMMQQLIWRTRPNVIIETGIAHGGSVVLHASMLKLVHDQPAAADRPHVIAVDIEIRPANRAALEAHALRPMFTLIEGSSIDARVVSDIRQRLRPHDRVMVVLDSNHTRAHVAGELHAYGPLVSPGCAMVVMDGVMPQLARLPSGDRRWESDHPGFAIAEFLESPEGAKFSVDHSFDGMAPTHSPGGVLMRSERRA